MVVVLFISIYFTACLYKLFFTQVTVAMTEWAFLISLYMLQWQQRQFNSGWWNLQCDDPNHVAVNGDPIIKSIAFMILSKTVMVLYSYLIHMAFCLPEWAGKKKETPGKQMALNGSLIVVINTVCVMPTEKGAVITGILEFVWEWDSFKNHEPTIMARWSLQKYLSKSKIKLKARLPCPNAFVWFHPLARCKTLHVQMLIQL